MPLSSAYYKNSYTTKRNSGIPVYAIKSGRPLTTPQKASPL